jgi:ParB family chromosome partitioning protein
MLNFGARRLRASRLAGKTDIPVFIDETADSYDQVIENEHRDGLKPIELALFIKRELDAGRSQAEIARRLGKTPAYISYVCAMVDPPDWLLALYRAGKCRGIKELYDLRRLHGMHGDAVIAWIDGRQFISRADIAELAVQCGQPPIEPHVQQPDAAGRTGEGATRPSPRTAGAVPQPRRAEPRDGIESRGRLILLADVEGTAVEVLLSVTPEGGDGVVVVSKLHGGPHWSIPLERIVNLRIERCRESMPMTGSYTEGSSSPSGGP